MLTLPEIKLTAANRPTIIFTRDDQPASMQVIEKLRELAQEPNSPECTYHVFSKELELPECFASGGYTPERALVISDGFPHSKGHCFSHHARGRNRDIGTFPNWSGGAHWGIVVANRTDSCAYHTRAIFLRNFEQRIAERGFPWGSGRAGEAGSNRVHIDETELARVITALNAGPDLASAIANPEFRDRLPTGSKFSWNRIPTAPMICDHQRWQAVDNAFAEFETASNDLLLREKSVQDDVLAGVTFADQDMQGFYLWPRAKQFSVRRPDMHYRGPDSFFASENDEMPGGLAELVHLDQVYGVNRERWDRAFGRLFAKGPVLFVVSSNWSKVYIEELWWLVKQLREGGYEAFFSTTDVPSFTTTPTGVYMREDSDRIATVWRQFPIFETQGELAYLVMLAQQGKIDLVPEFAHFGNKAWFSIFRQHREYFRATLSPQADILLDSILPDSHQVRAGRENFPMTVAGTVIPNLDALRNLPAHERNKLVLKITGANALAARSYGVVMDRDMPQAKWAGWIDERIAKGEPFIVQQQMATEVVHIPAKRLERNGSGTSELFAARVLVRPWSVYGEVVSAHISAVTHTTRKVHGMTDMALHAADFGS